MNLKRLGLAAVVSGFLAIGNADAQQPCQTIINQLIPYSHPLVKQFPQPRPCRTCSRLDEVKQTQTKLTLPLRHLEPGFYRTILEQGNQHYVLGGLENTFKMTPATPGLIIPNNKQTTSWCVSPHGLVKPGTYDLYAGGNNWDLKLGRVQLNEGNKIYFDKVADLDYRPANLRPQQPTLALAKSHH